MTGIDDESEAFVSSHKRQKSRHSRHYPSLYGTDTDDDEDDDDKNAKWAEEEAEHIKNLFPGVAGPSAGKRKHATIANKLEVIEVLDSDIELEDSRPTLGSRSG
jgi:hypothetical protein